MAQTDTEVFENKPLSELLRDVYTKTNIRGDEINGIIDQLKRLINTSNDAIVIGPIIQQFLEVAVKNDDHFLKIGTIVQRLISADSYKGSGDDGALLSDSEKEQLIRNAKQEVAIKTHLEELSKNTTDVVTEMKKIQEEHSDLIPRIPSSV